METEQNTLQNVDIETVGGGALPELFADELKLVLEDIENVNKIRDSTRTIQLTVTIVPDKQSKTIRVACTSSAKLGKRENVADVMYIHRGKFVRNDMEQLEIPGTDVVSINSKREAK
jgi:hypothetical protein